MLTDIALGNRKQTALKNNFNEPSWIWHSNLSIISIPFPHWYKKSGHNCGKMNKQTKHIWLYPSIYLSIWTVLVIFNYDFCYYHHHPYHQFVFIILHRLGTPVGNDERHQQVLEKRLFCSSISTFFLLLIRIELSNIFY